MAINQEIVETVQIELNHVTLQTDPTVLVCLHFLLEGKELLKTLGNDSEVLVLSRHCIGLSRSCLAVSKDANVIPIKGTLDKLLSLFKYFDLCARWSEAGTKGELSFAELASHSYNFPPLPEQGLIFLQLYFKGKVINNCDCVEAASVELCLAHRPDSAEDSDVALHLLDLIVQFLAHDRFVSVLDPYSLNLCVHFLVVFLQQYQLLLLGPHFIILLVFYLLVHGFQRLDFSFQAILFRPILMNNFP